MKISVVIPVYNGEKYLKECINSVLNQPYKDIEIITINDGSKDNTYKKAKSYAEQYENIILIQNDKNMGLNYTLNHCLEYVDTEYVARMDADDISLLTRLEKEINFLDDHHEYAIVSTPMIYFDEHGDFRVGKGNGEVIKSDFIKGTPFCHAPCMVRSEAYRKVNILLLKNYLGLKIIICGTKCICMVIEVIT